METPPCSSCSERWDPTAECWEFGQRLFRVHPDFTNIVGVHIRALNRHMEAKLEEAKLQEAKLQEAKLQEAKLQAQVRRFFKNVEATRRRKMGNEMTRR